MTAKRSYDSIDGYIADQAELAQERLEAIRELVLETVPDVTEAISYGIPTFKLGGNLLHIAAWKHHISIYPSSSTIEAALPEIAARSNGKGTIQFPNDEPLPLDLIREYVQLRVAEFERA